MTPPSSDSFSAPAPQLSVVVAAYNAAPLIAGTTQQILDFFDEHRIAGEVVVVDDGSRDETFAAIPKNERVVALRLPVNQGKGA
ncbi:MAG: glycosyltransferase, partial [Candidatus Sumerlaeota bacterium]|nr:glycosyltransferase [Candidatus Sumerlaeota bacterium]